MEIVLTVGLELVGRVVTMANSKVLQLLSWSSFAIILNTIHLSPVETVLDIRYFSEGPCLKNEPPTRYDQTWARNTFLESYTTMGSITFYNTISQLLRARDLDSIQEAEESGCLQGAGDLSARTISGFGVGPVTVSCNFTTKMSSSLNRFSCSPIISKAQHATGKVTTQFIFPKHVLVTWTNYIDTMVMVHCLANNHRGWAAVSSRADISQATKQSIIQHIKALGFSLDKAIRPKFDKCGFSRRVGSGIIDGGNVNATATAMQGLGLGDGSGAVYTSEGQVMVGSVPVPVADTENNIERKKLNLLQK